MPEYIYKAVDENGVVVKNRVQDKSKQNLIKKLKVNGLMPIDVTQVSFGKGSKSGLKRNSTNIDEIMQLANSANLAAKRESRKFSTFEKINMTLRTYTGGYLRFEGDHYREGKSPWSISTLWMAMYYKEIGQKNKAQECIDYIVNSANKHGFIGEQIDNNTMQPNWVIGLTWAHAMFILSL